MTLAEFCVLGALLLYLATIVSIKWTRFRIFDNSRPRDPAFFEDALAQRALGAHQNGIETFPFFLRGAACRIPGFAAAAD